MGAWAEMDERGGAQQRQQRERPPQLLLPFSIPHESSSATILATAPPDQALHSTATVVVMLQHTNIDNLSALSYPTAGSPQLWDWAWTGLGLQPRTGVPVAHPSGHGHGASRPSPT